MSDERDDVTRGDAGTADEPLADTRAAAPEAPVETAATPPPPPPAGRRGRGLFWGALGGCLLLFLLLTVAGSAVALVGRDSGEWWTIGPKVAIVPVEGEIFDARPVLEMLRNYAEDQSVRALVVRINSPGGAIVPSHEIFAGIRSLREETGKPIIASLDSVAASGGYYVAAGCDAIVANPGSITGSIGVIAQWFNLEGLLAWAKLDPETITSGSMKDAGSPLREMTPEERAYLQRIVSQLHQQFIRAVAEGREGKLSEAEIEKLADGRVFTGEEAFELKLVDRLGTLQDAVDLAAERAGIRGEPRTVWPREEVPGLLELLVDGQEAKTLVRELVHEPVRGMQFLYRWY
ncbi:MAG: signal peptide peptidase SppA [Thermoanaerobaculia bacterium]